MNYEGHHLKHGNYQGLLLFPCFPQYFIQEIILYVVV
uniref:Uncharacterized protein n=1 Tax=Rhizophora mucronata TaxID=61149 RepID=A0A2P2P7A3_RHIMU